MSALGEDMAFGPFQMDDGASVNSSCEFKAQIFDEIEIELSPVYYSGEKFEIFAENSAADHPYIPPANLKGKEWNSVSFSHLTFARGGELRLSLAKKSNRDWGQ